MNFVPDRKMGEANKLGYVATSFPQAHLEDGFEGYTTTQNEKKLSGEIVALLMDAGATEISMTPGTVTGRAAFQLRFKFSGVYHQITQVALPCRTRSDRNLQQAKRQALYHLLRQLRSDLERRHYQPTIPPFIAYMIPQGSPVSFGEYIQRGEMPPLLLTSGDE